MSRRKLNYIIIITLFGVIIYSCGHSFNGKIERRDLDKAYLVNKSTSKYYQFTVKVTTITNDSVYDYETRLIKLAPGDEAFLGVFRDTSDMSSIVIEAEVFKVYFPRIPSYKEVMSDSAEKGLPEFLQTGTIEILPDTIKDGEKIKRQYIYGGLSHRLYQLKDQLDILNKLKDTIINDLNGKFEFVMEKSIGSLPPVFNSYKYEVRGQIDAKDDIKVKK